VSAVTEAEPPLGDGTRAVHAGLPEPRQGTPLIPGPTFAAYYHLEGDPAGSEYVYGRYGNPSWTLYERALGELEGGTAVAFASGMAAASAVLLPLLRSGDALVAPADGYPAVRSLATGHLAERGVDVRLVPAGEQPADEALSGARLVWLETPSNPGLETTDVAEAARRAHAAGALVAVDNTLATPLGQRPLELGADFSVASDSKHLTGHGDLILGHVAARDPAHAEALVAWRTQTGAVPGPFEAWLAHRSLATLELRLERQCGTALALAERLLFRDDLAGVRHPGLPADPAHEVARRQMTRFGTVITFTLESRERAEAFLSACRLVAQATSFGSVHSSAERRARWGGDDVPDGFVRFSVGCETPEDLIADVERALDLSAGLQG
jgi:cystathionine gamma-lyase